MVVDKRNTIVDNLESGTTIVTDMWQNYNSLEQKSV